jgi:predicted amidohydrolase
VPPFEYRGLKIGVTICMDARIFELYREYAFQGANLILKPNCAWVGPWREDGAEDFDEKAGEHERAMRADWEKDSHFAACNGMAMIAANAVGDTGGPVLPGGCWFCDGTAGTMKHLRLSCEKSKLRERMLVGEIDIKKIKTLQASHGVQTDLRLARSYYPPAAG